MKIIIYIAVMAGVTYLIRMIPFTFFNHKVQSRFFKRFLYFVPFAVLSAMTFPAAFSSTGDTITAVVGTIVALILAMFNSPLIAVSVAAAVATFITSLVL